MQQFTKDFSFFIKIWADFIFGSVLTNSKQIRMKQHNGSNTISKGIEDDANENGKKLFSVDIGQSRYTIANTVLILEDRKNINPVDIARVLVNLCRDISAARGNDNYIPQKEKNNIFQRFYQQNFL
jgi:hypothetical protein